MPGPVTFQSTPNPRAFKCVLSRHVPALQTTPNGPRSYSSPAAATVDPLAQALFAIPGVSNVFIADTWLTVGLAETAAWKTIRPKVEEVLRAI